MGLLEQEPYLDPAKTVYENVMDGVAEVKALLDEYNEVLAAWADPDADYEALGARQQRLEDKIAAADVESRSHRGDGDGGAAVPPATGT